MNQNTNNLIIKICTILLIICGSRTLNAQDEAWVKIHYLGHAAFVMEFDNGVTIVNDYGHFNAWVASGWDSPIYNIGSLIPDIMTYSHFHDDHYDPDRIPEGVPHILSEMDSLEYNGINILPIRTCETSVNIESNTSFLFLYKNLKILHLGDAQAQIIAIKDFTVRMHMLQIIPDDLDMLFMTIEGQTKFIPQAEEFVRLFHPKCIIPIHHWSQAYLEDFLDYLETKNTTSEIYQIVEDDTSDYLLSSEDTVTPTKVIALKRSAYTVTTGIEKKRFN